jgi:hypothetical protein
VSPITFRKHVAFSEYAADGAIKTTGFHRQCLSTNAAIPCRVRSHRRPTTPKYRPTAANLLLPADGGAFTLANDVVTLQWSSIGTLRDNEFYRVVVEDITEGQSRRMTDYVTDTKFIVPTTFRPRDNVAHVIRWWISTVRQTGSDEQGEPIYSSAGAESQKWVFTCSAPQKHQA